MLDEASTSAGGYISRGLEAVGVRKRTYPGTKSFHYLGSRGTNCGAGWNAYAAAIRMIFPVKSAEEAYRQ